MFQIIKNYVKSSITQRRPIDGILRNDYMRQNFISDRLLGEGSYGHVFIAKKINLNANNEIFEVNFAIKQIKNEYSNIEDINNAFQSSFFRILNLEFLLNHNNTNILKHIYIWMEMDVKSLEENKCNVILNQYIQIELCDFKLSDLIEEIIKYSLHFENNSLTLLGYYISCQLFKQIIEELIININKFLE